MDKAMARQERPSCRRCRAANLAVPLHLSFRSEASIAETICAKKSLPMARARDQSQPMSHFCSDLVARVAKARQIVPDDRYIWCRAADTFDTALVQRHGLLLGGAFSPHFLRDSTAVGCDTPWAVQLRRCRVLTCNHLAKQPIGSWLPLMEKVAAEGESLLVVTDSIGSELLNTFVVNAIRGTLPVCVVHPAGDRSGRTTTRAQFAAPWISPEQLPRVEEVWIRRTASVCFPSAGEPLSSSAAIQTFAIIETGGENHEDQSARLRFLMQELQQPGNSNHPVASTIHSSDEESPCLPIIPASPPRLAHDFHNQEV